jgi:two-component system sensor histidine kinase MprB
LALLAAAAVAVAVLAVSGFSWLVVRASLHQQLTDQLSTDARTIAAQPSQWRYEPPGPPQPPRPGRGWGGYPHDGGRDIGTRWQLLDAAGAPMIDAGRPVALPVTNGSRNVAAGRAPRAMETVQVRGFRYRMLTVPATGGGAVQVAVSSEPIEHTLTVLGLVLALGSLAGIAGAALLGRTVARAGLAPVERLTQAVEHVTATQDLNAAIAVRGADEIARLARSFNAMLAALDASRAAQRMLVEDAGHELRTPLTSLRNNVELLIHADSPAAAGRTLPAEERRHLLRDLAAQMGELTLLTSELVELAREESSPEPVEEVELADVVGAAVDRARVRAPGLTFDTSLRPVAVTGRPAALERAVLNILDNAAKWSPAGSTVRVRLGEAHGGAVLTVADSGPGIDEADRPKVFERFYRATAARSMPGSGLGLAIVAQTVTQHGGTVDVGRSDAGGALITVRLPAG